MTTSGWAGLAIAAIAGLAGCGQRGDRAAAAGSGSAAAAGSGSAHVPIARGPALHGSGSAGSAAPGSDADELDLAAGSDVALPAPPLSTPKLLGQRGSADLQVGGAVTATLTQVAGTCACDGERATFTVHDQGAGAKLPMSLTVIATNPVEWANPAVLLSVSAPRRGSWGRTTAQATTDDKVSIAKDCSGVALDVHLRGVAGTKGEVSLRGTVRCAP